MEVWELLKELRKSSGIESVWESKEFLLLDEGGHPIIESWYKSGKDTEFIHKDYRYMDGKWVEIKPCPHTREVDGIIEKCAGEEGHIGYHSPNELTTMKRKMPLGSDDDSHA